MEDSNGAEMIFIVPATFLEDISQDFFPPGKLSKIIKKEKKEALRDLSYSLGIKASVLLCVA